MSQYEHFVDPVATIAETGAEIALSYFRQAILIEMKANQTPVTIADKKTEEAIRERLGAEFPNFGILGEEFGEQSVDSEFVFTIDPIDGTRSFIRGIPLFGTLIGLLHKGEPVMGVMVLPALNETYVAAKGMGTFCNGVQLHVSSTLTLESATVSCGDIYAFRESGKMDYLTRLLETPQVVRAYTDCFGHSLVLRGAMDAMVDPVVSVWDVAPLAILVKEAGGEYFSFDGKASIYEQSFITCTPALKKSLLKL